MLGEGSVRICERGADHGNILPALQESLIFVQSEKNEKTTRKYFMKKNPKRAQWKK